MITYNKLRGRIYEKYKNLTTFAKALGVSANYVSQKLHGDSDFTKKSMDKWAELLDIPVEQYAEFFFT